MVRVAPAGGLRAKTLSGDGACLEEVAGALRATGGSTGMDGKAPADRFAFDYSEDERNDLEMMFFWPPSTE